MRFQYQPVKGYDNCFTVWFNGNVIGTVKQLRLNLWLDPESGRHFAKADDAASVLKTRFYKRMAKLRVAS